MPPLVEFDLPDRRLGRGIADGVRVANVGERRGPFGRIRQLQEPHEPGVRKRRGCVHQVAWSGILRGDRALRSLKGPLASF
ncbi:MAG: hypothetical protein ACK56F_06720 [bacterium]